MKRKADHEVEIEDQRISRGRVDSLDVIVAAEQLCEAFFRKPRSAAVAINEVSDTLVPDVILGRDMDNMLFKILKEGKRHTSRNAPDLGRTSCKTSYSFGIRYDVAN